jgi:LmbE family N-acetylglucosaminyl deacetylase
MMIHAIQEAGGVNVVVAHPDDEVLFCGGVLAQLAADGLRIRIHTTVGVGYCNRIEGDVAAENARQMARETALREVGAALGGAIINFGCADQSVVSGWPTVESFLSQDYLLPIITHGPGGETGHPAHVATHHLVMAIVGGHPAKFGPVYGFTAPGRCCLQCTQSQAFQIDVRDKRDLLNLYREGGHRTPIWDPAENELYAPWLRATESFIKYREADK